MSKRVVAHCQRCRKEWRMTREEKQRHKVLDMPILCSNCYDRYTSLLIERISKIIFRNSEAVKQ